jgi:hypothetical protein
MIATFNLSSLATYLHFDHLLLLHLLLLHSFYKFLLLILFFSKINFTALGKINLQLGKGAFPCDYSVKFCHFFGGHTIWKRELGPAGHRWYKGHHHKKNTADSSSG